MLGSCIASYNLGILYQIRETKISEQHPLCYDTKKQEAWVARKNGVLRCFMENREYPHKSKGSYID